MFKASAAGQRGAQPPPVEIVSQKEHMGTRHRKMYYESVAAGRPQFLVVPPASVFAADMGDTLVNSIFAFGGTWLAVGGIQYISSHNFDAGTCLAWSSVIAGSVMLAPVAGDVLADFLSDIRAGWERGHVEPEQEPEPEPQIEIQPEPTEDEAGSARIEGEWWYRANSGRLCCYQTPRDKYRRPIVSDVRMRAVFGSALTGTPFSEREMTERVRGLSGPRFRILKRDWRTRYLYTMNDDRSGYFTATGKLIASVIADGPTPPG